MGGRRFGQRVFAILFQKTSKLAEMREFQIVKSPHRRKSGHLSNQAFALALI